jgi:signal peptidase II
MYPISEKPANMLKAKNRQTAYWILLSLLIIVMDQLTKILSVRYLDHGHTKMIFPGFDLTLQYNTGAAFSFLAGGSGWQRWFFIVLALIVSAIIVVWLSRIAATVKQEALALSFILGGALGNLIDRVVYGHVIDFILIYYKHWSWPAFNLADSFICLGMLLLMPGLLRQKT